MTVGFYSPWPPARTGVADYSAALFRELCKLGDVRVSDPNADIALYHIGNNSQHRDIYRQALARPGVAVLHDALLHHFFLGTLDQAAYTEEFVYNYGEWSRGLAQQLWTHRARSGADPRYFNYPMIKRVAETSRAVIVHNPAAAAIVKRHAPDTRIFEIPHLFLPPQAPAEIDTLRFRESLGLGPRTLLAGVFGHQRESKRLAVVLRAFARALASGVDARLLVSGAFVSEVYERSLEPLLNGPRILRTGYLPDREFWRYAAATDLCINLRFPSAAETSGVAIAMMGIGKPVAFTAGEETARIPSNACLRVDVGLAEEGMLAGYMVWLAQDREAGAAIGTRAAAHIASEHAPRKAARLYWEACSECPRP